MSKKSGSLQDLIGEINTSYGQFISVVESYPRNKSEEVLVGNYSFKDVLAHITEWDNFLIESFKAIEKGTLMPHKLNIKRMNLEFYEKNKEKSLDTVLKELKEVHSKLMEYLPTFDENYLTEPDPYYPEKHSIYTLAQHCTSLHYPWAIKAMKK